MTWPETSKHYIDIWKRRDYEDPVLSYGDKCRKQYEASFGKKYEGEMDGEIGWSEISHLYA